MKINPLKGMKDYLPQEQRIRDFVQGRILEVYRGNGFERIATPMLEDMENLDKSEGGDNLNLIFKVLKRGEKLTAALENGGDLFTLQRQMGHTDLQMTKRYTEISDKLLVECHQNYSPIGLLQDSSRRVKV